MYVVIVDHGYDGYSVKDCDNLDDLLEAYNDHGNMIFSIYKIESELSLDDLETLKQKREQSRVAAIAAAKAKLTPEECKPLGIA